MPQGLSNREAAKIAGVSHVAIAKAKEARKIAVLDDGSISSDALAKWASERRAPRGGNHRDVTAPPRTPVTAPVRLPACADGTAASNAAAVIALLNADGVFADRADAERYRDSYVALLRQVEYDQKVASVASVEDITRIVGEQLARVRTRFLALPAEQAPALHRCKTPAEVQDLLMAFVVEVLEELSGGGNELGQS